MDDLTMNEVIVCPPPNSIAITITPHGHEVSLCIGDKVSDKTFYKLLSRVTQADRIIRASAGIDSNLLIHNDPEDTPNQEDGGSLT